MKKIRLGSGAGYSGDRIEPAVELAEKGEIQYLCFECLAERTIAIAQQAKMKDPAQGYDALLAARMEAVLPICHKKGIKIITNMGAANPQAGAAKIKQIAEKLNIKGLKIAAVSGDDVLAAIRDQDLTIEETGAKLSTIKDKLVSANAYLGVAPIIEALQAGADGSLVITKVESAGGMVTLATCKEQLLYEIHNPKTYFTPDVVADFTGVKMEQIGKDQVRVSGGTGGAKTGLLKVSLGYVDSYIGEGQISYAGPGAVNRGQLALDIVKERLEFMGVKMQENRYDLMGVDSLHGEKLSAGHDPYEVRVRVTGRTETMAEAVRIGNEVETLYTNGPAGGGGAWKSAREVVAMVSVIVPDSVVNYSVQYEVI